MASIFKIYNWISAPATITYDDDDNLIDVVANLGSEGTFTFKNDVNPSGNLHPFAGQIFYTDLEKIQLAKDTPFELRTGGKYAVVTFGEPKKESEAVVVSYNERIVSKKYDAGVGDWTFARPKGPRERETDTRPHRRRFQFELQSDKEDRANRGDREDENRPYPGKRPTPRGRGESPDRPYGPPGGLDGPSDNEDDRRDD
ncbi:unnamed protein product [Rhizoctonia solani]|uniref:Uncharacterized protein n=1 Tax=Rhizoctonia solani TaxID=456999 RepID=A0A8H3I4S2_9AGAM|nr:unnamed protein product [Rhizoctonia solani]